MLIAAVDGLTGFPDAINAVFPDTEVQLCIVQVVRSPTKHVAFKGKKAIASGLKPICTSPAEELAEVALEGFAKRWGGKCPMTSKPWSARWPEAIPSLKFPPEIRAGVHTADAIESPNCTIQKVVRHRQSFLNSMVEPPFGLFQVEIEFVGLYAAELGQPCLCCAPEVPRPVDVRPPLANAPSGHFALKCRLQPAFARPSYAFRSSE